MMANNQSEKEISVLNPLGQPPPIRASLLAPRLDSISAKKIYVVDVKFPASKPFLEELVRALRERYSETTWVPVEKQGNYFDDDPDLWSNIKKHADGAIVLVGH
jgi:hypothetical protein